MGSVGVQRKRLNKKKNFVIQRGHLTLSCFAFACMGSEEV